MAKPYKPRRTKLKRHDQGQDRHNKGTALWSKLTRLQVEHNKIQRKPKPKRIKKPKYRNDALRAYVEQLRRHQVTVNKDRVELFAAALESDRYRQCRGQLRMPAPDSMSSFHCALGVATQVALDNGLREESGNWWDDPWSESALHPMVSTWYGWGDDELISPNPEILLHGEETDIITANDAGFSFWDIAQAVRAKWLKDEG